MVPYSSRFPEVRTIRLIGFPKYGRYILAVFFIPIYFQFLILWKFVPGIKIRRRSFVNFCRGQNIKKVKFHTIGEKKKTQEKLEDEDKKNCAKKKTCGNYENTGERKLSDNRGP